ncbi:acylphosphatase [Larkinella soli]|uniref:acylphosphatase n=1 Tax=Larkinella soli TaxID=1770527 RepID=UPI000FFB3C00|nr:acylphosphatase [Larkinella soli]
MKKHLTIRVFGKVQGVFFRQSTRQTALELGLTGRVRNELDGTVLIEVEGESDQLETFLDWCRIGPPRAQVSGLEVAQAPLQAYESFEVERF